MAKQIAINRVKVSFINKSLRYFELRMPS